MTEDWTCKQMIFDDTIGYFTVVCGTGSELRRTAVRDRFEGAVTVIWASPFPNPSPVTLPLTQIAKVI